MHRLFLIALLISPTLLTAQTPKDSTSRKERLIQADDPSQFLTRFELFNDFQHYDNSGGYDLNQTIFRTNVKIGKKFTTRLDIPYVTNSVVRADNPKSAGLGDITFRLLGYKIIERPRGALTASIEISMNTAQSSILGTGKNLLVPVVSYTRVFPKNKMLLAFVFQQANSISGDEARADVNFSKLQFVVLKSWSRKAWTVLTPELYYDYTKSSLSMNLGARMTLAPTPRFNIWMMPGAGVFGNFVGRYVWSLEVGTRFFLFSDRG